MSTISVERADEIYYDEALAIQAVENHRWYTTLLVVFDSTEGLYGFYYLDPASELQEDQDRYEDDPVPIFPVKVETITTKVYSPR